MNNLLEIGGIDYPSQEYLDRFASRFLVVGGLIASGAAFWTQDYSTLYIGFAIVYLISLVIVVPLYSNYKKENYQWL